ncbi:LacI family DNA-binding transcriptional regulator [Streptomyces sp. NPDC016845]|uniref:LacI family DNA-binding transcriptional regulator n=1 Tax=Streptomyces sp. NPDC016845 TaxID=3364972 RepID=UPI00378840F6
MRQRVGMVDVAREAGVSLGTVSNVYNQPEKVSPDTRRRVQAAIDRLGYVRSETARVLRGRPSRIMAVIVHDLANPFCVALVQGAEQAARRAGLGIMVCNSAGDPAEETRYASLLIEHRIRGALLAPTESSGRTVRAMKRGQIPLVVFDDLAPGGDVCSVAVDDVLGGELATAHLLAAGHRSIAFVGGPPHLPQVQARSRGTLRALARARLPASTVTELDCEEMTTAAGRDAGARILGLPTRPTGVFCANDLLATGVLQALFEAGVHVPDDIALVGYDDIEHAAAAAVPLTSVRRPARFMGTRAATLLIDKTSSASPADHTHQQLVLRPELVVRRSSARREPTGDGAMAHRPRPARP